MKRIFSGLLIFSLLTALLCCATGFSGRQRSEMVGGRRYMNMRDLADLFHFRVTLSGGYFHLTGKRQLTFEHNRREMYLDRVRVILSYAAQLRNGTPMVSLIDLQKTVSPLLRASATRAHPVRTIVLDPGHGGADTGCRGWGLEEKRITLQIAFRVKALLQRAGYRGLMTRVSDRTLQLGDRPAYAGRVGADLFVSIHVNATQNRAITGVETFAMTPVNMVSAHGSSPERHAENGSGPELNSFLLAYRIQSALVRRKVGEDRGVKRSRFLVLRRAACPAVLVETGFLSNASEGRKLARPDHQDKLARAIVDGILAYHRDMLRKR